MASIKHLLSSKTSGLLLGEVTERIGKKYKVDLKDRIVNIESSISDVLSIGTQVFVTNIENELRIIAQADIKTREEKETVIVNG